MDFIRPSRMKFTVAFAALAAVLAQDRPAKAEVTILKNDVWELYTTGRINAFFSYGFGDANPPPSHGSSENLPVGGGLNVDADVVPKFGPDGTPEPQGTFSSMRVRSGFVPNVFALGLRRRINDDMAVNAYFGLWATIDSEGQRKGTPVYADAREGWLQVESHRWGTLQAGKELDLFSRGATQNDFLYMHGYGLGFPGNIDSFGPTNGMIGFGVLAAFYSAGITYATPNLYGVQLTAGIYDPTPLPGFYESTRDARPEAELTYDLTAGMVKLHLFGNGGYQVFYKPASNDSAAAYGAGYGGRIEVGPAHLGVAGHYGRGLGLQYAFQAGDVSVAPTLHLRYFDGYSVFGQYVWRKFDFNAGWGISRTLPLDSDKVPGANISLPTQWAISAGVVYHATEFLHFDVDGMYARADWSLGEKQEMAFLNTGVVVTW